MTYPLVIRRNIGELSEVSKHLNVLRQVFDRILTLSFGGPGKKKHSGRRSFMPAMLSNRKSSRNKGRLSAMGATL